MRRQCELLSIQRSIVYYKAAPPEEQHEHDEAITTGIQKCRILALAKWFGSCKTKNILYAGNRPNG